MRFARNATSCETAYWLDDLSHYGSVVGETAFELDDELADVNHAAVVQGLDAIVAALKAPDGLLEELTGLLTVKFPDESPPPQCDHTPVALPEAPVPVDPHTMEIDEDEEYDRYHLMSQQFASNADDQTRHLRALMTHAEGLLGRVVGAAGSGDVADACAILAERRPLIDALAATLFAWEVAIGALDHFTGGGAGLASEQIQVTERWLADVTDRGREKAGE